MLVLSTLIAAYNHDAAVIASGVLMCVMAVLSIAICVIVLMQKSNQDDVSSISGGNSETYLKKHKEINSDKRLKLATIIMGVLLAVLAIIFFIIAPTA